MTSAQLLKAIKTTLDWLPNWGISLIIFVAVALLALVVHGIAYGILGRLTAKGGEFWRSFVTGTKGLARGALLVLAVGLASRLAPLSPAEADGFAKFVQVGIILLIGWTALVALGIATRVYTKRFDIGAEDNLLARKHVTQVRLLRRAAQTLIVVVTVAAAMMTFDSVRQFGVSLLASAGAAGLVVGLALQPILANLIAGIQIAVTEPIKLEDVVIVEGEWGRIEEITATYVVVRIWDLRRLVVPLKYFIDHPFQNWTRESSALLGTVVLYVDYTVPVDAVREKLKEIVEAAPQWDKQVASVSITDTTERSVQMRLLISAKNSGQAWDLRCLVREKMLGFLQKEYPHALPRHRAEIAPNAASSEGERQGLAATTGN
jgi:small-conductance mechanosensitive channel